MNINELTIGQLKEIRELCTVEKSTCGSPWKVGENYLVRTVTYFVVGTLKSIGDKELVFQNASWVCDTGRFHDALKTGSFNEVEPFLDDVILGRDSIIDATKWRHGISLCQK